MSALSRHPAAARCCSRPHRLWRAAAALLLPLLITLVGTAPAALAASEPQAAPLNPAFLQYQQDLRAGRLLLNRAAGGGSFGLVPAPVDIPSIVGAPAGPGPLGLPSSYDLRMLSKVTSVKNQNPYGTCWAFATYGSLESALMPTESWDFSEDNMVLTAGFDYDPYNGGGTSTMSTAYLARGGAVSESDDPYGDDVAVAGLAPRMRLQDMSIVCNDGSSTKDTANDIAAIKNALTAHGALFTTMNWNNAGYRSATAAYYGSPSSYWITNAGHAVTIVGWDDNYSASNFATTPAGNGAWIVKNSWGAAWGLQGYFYMSYYDYWAERYACFFTPMNVGSYTRAYQYDPLGWCSNFGGGSTAWGANDFIASSSDPVVSVGFYAPVPNTQYEIFTAAGHAGSRTSRAVGTVSYAGYHVITLSSPLSVTSGQVFSIITKVSTPNYAYPLAIECAISGYSSGATPAAGRSFFSPDGSNWTDMGDPSVFGYLLCIKAFARPAGTDSTAPTTTANGVPSGWVNTSPVTVTFTATDNGWGVLYTDARVDSNLYRQSSQVVVQGTGTHTVNYCSIDKAGNWEAVRASTVRIDTTAPVTTAAGLQATNATGWRNSAQTVTLTPSDGSGSGVAHTYYTVDGGGQQAGTTFTVSAAGSHAVTYWSTDNVGWAEGTHTGYVNIDGVAPTTTAAGLQPDDHSGWRATAQAVTLARSDSGGSGLAHTYYSIDGGAQLTYVGAFAVTGSGSHAVTYWSVDNAGNSEAVHTGYVNIDGVAPVTSASGVPAGWSRTVAVTLSANDATSGVKTIEYRLKGTAAWQLYTAPFAVTDQGAVTYEFGATDNAGNVEATKSVTVQVDSVAPTTTAYAASVKHGKKVRLTYRVSDAVPGSGQAAVTIKIFKGTKLKKTLAVGACAANARGIYSWRCALAKGSYTIKVYATDLAGNVQSAAGGAKLKVK